LKHGFIVGFFGRRILKFIDLFSKWHLCYSFCRNCFIWCVYFSPFSTVSYFCLLFHGCCLCPNIMCAKWFFKVALL